MTESGYYSERHEVRFSCSVYPKLLVNLTPWTIVGSSFINENNEYKMTVNICWVSNNLYEIPERSNHEKIN